MAESPQIPGGIVERNRWYGPLVRSSDWAWRALVVLALAAVLLWAGLALSGIVVPTLLALAVIPVGRPLVELLERRLPSALAAAVVLLLAVAILGVTGWLLIASVAANWEAMWDGMSEAVVVVADWIDTQVEALSDAQIAEIRENLSDLIGTVSSVLVGGATRGVAAIGSLLVGFFLFVVTLYFGLRDWPQFKEWVIRNVTDHTKPQASLFLERYDVILRNYWKGQALIGVFDAVALAVALWLIGVPLVVPIAVLTFVVSFIPYVGAVVSTVLAVLVTLGTQGGGSALLVLVACLLIFNTGENLMRPWLVGETIEMPTFVVFLVSTVGVLLAGALGAVLAIPVVALVLEAQRIFMADADDEVLAGET